MRGAYFVCQCSAGHPLIGFDVPSLAGVPKIPPKTPICPLCRERFLSTVVHRRPYRISVSAVDDLSRRALTFVLELHARGELSEGQCCKALQLDRVSFREVVDAEDVRRQ